MKLCPKCDTPKDNGAFYMSKGRLSSYCRECAKERSRNCPRNTDQAKRYQETHRGEKAAYDKEYYRLHKDARKKHNKEYQDKRMREICVICAEPKKVSTRIEGKPVCHKCYMRERCKTDERFRLTMLLRRRLSQAFQEFSQYGKKFVSRKYGIDYGRIVDHLGPCPGERQDYHIDHVFPLSAFDFDDTRQVRAAFAPENHQWLLVGQNLSKHDSYDRQAFDQYLKRFEEDGVQ